MNPSFQLANIKEPDLEVVDLTEPITPRQLYWNMGGVDGKGMYDEYTCYPTTLMRPLLVRLYQSSWLHVVAVSNLKKYEPFPKRLQVDFSSLPSNKGMGASVSLKAIPSSIVLDIRKPVILQAAGLIGNKSQDHMGNYWQYICPTNELSSRLVARVYERGTHLIGEITYNNGEWIYSAFPIRVKVLHTVE